MPEPAYVGLGSNLGDRQGFLEAAAAALASWPGVTLVAASSVYETAPEGLVEQPSFFNAAVAVRTGLPPVELLAVLRRIEDRHHRQRTIRWGPRTLDLDLLLCGAHVLDTPTLVLPHPRLTERCFALAPLCELDPGLRHPVTGRPLVSCYQELDCVHRVRRVGPLPIKSDRSSADI
jgi:2-amino-4-hydroxy-6-hydroxymethyldihydropteridine diphosphokinase